MKGWVLAEIYIRRYTCSLPTGGVGLTRSSVDEDREGAVDGTCGGDPHRDPWVRPGAAVKNTAPHQVASMFWFGGGEVGFNSPHRKQAFQKSPSNLPDDQTLR